MLSLLHPPLEGPLNLDNTDFLFLAHLHEFGSLQQQLLSQGSRKLQVHLQRIYNALLPVPLLLQNETIPSLDTREYSCRRSGEPTTVFQRCA